MDPVAWGPPFWALLHSASLVNTRQARAELQSTLDAMERVLPCKYCRESLRALRPTLAKIEFAGNFEEMWALHNAVSAKLQIQGGSGAPITLERARRRWESATEPVSELQLVNALIITAGNYARCPAPEKRRWYAQMWRGIAALCARVPTLRSLGTYLTAGGEGNGCALLERANARRSEILRSRGLGELCVDKGGARRRIAGKARGGRAR
jgi:hypothetical protein